MDDSDIGATLNERLRCLGDMIKGVRPLGLRDGGGKRASVEPATLPAEWPDEEQLSEADGDTSP